MGDKFYDLHVPEFRILETDFLWSQPQNTVLDR